MRDRILANPRNYIAQPTLDLSTAPCLVEDGVEPRHVDLRPYILCGRSITVVPGGLTRVALQRGRSWSTHRRAAEARTHGCWAPDGDAVLSRVADSLYWMRRYIERADQIARVVGVNLDLAFDRAPADVARLWGRLLTALWSAPAWAQVDRGGTGEALTDLTNIDAVASCVAAARENARQVRQHISGEMWERVNGVHLTLNDPARRAAWAERPHGYFQTMREGAALFDAAVNAGLVRDDGWHFLQLGLFLERAGGTARLLECQLRGPPGARPDRALDEQLEWICCSSL